MDFCLEPPLDYFLSHVFDTAREQLLQVIFLHRLSCNKRFVLGKFALHSLHIDFQFPDLFRVIGLEDLNVALNLLSNVLLCHARGEQDVQELTEFKIVCRDRPLPIHARSIRHSV